MNRDELIRWMWDNRVTAYWAIKTVGSPVRVRVTTETKIEKVP